MSGTEQIQQLFDQMWKSYSQQNPQAKKIHDLFEKKGNRVINDHIALRTFNDPRVGIEKLAHSFREGGYREVGEYQFEEKKLFAKHFEHSGPKMPKVFISELKLESFSKGFNQLVKGLIEQVPAGFTEDFFFPNSGRPWKISYTDYQKLAQESEYGAWVAAFGYRPNHFTVSINDLESTNSIHALNKMIKEAGFKLNANGGEVKGSPEVLLEQSSTLADCVAVDFSDSQKVIPACYYEFAKRYPLPNGQLYQGFVAQSADKIFESTERGQGED